MEAPCLSAMNIDEDVHVSIVLTVYNNEDYLSRCIDSILTQRTDFRFEVLIGDDASTDCSLSIIQEYSELYPSIFKITSRLTNIGATANFADLVRQCQGKYLVFIDGDDYWIDPNKLQVQANYLENTEYFAVTHLVNVCNEHEVYSHTVPSEYGSKFIVRVEDFLTGKRFPLTATMLRHLPGQHLDSILNLVVNGSRNAGDTTLCIYILSQTPVPIINYAMTVYRCRAIKGHSNYNSITNFQEKFLGRLKIIALNDIYYRGLYNFSPLLVRLIGTVIHGACRSNVGFIDAIADIAYICKAIVVTSIRRLVFIIRHYLTD